MPTSLLKNGKWGILIKTFVCYRMIEGDTKVTKLSPKSSESMDEYVHSSQNL